MQLTTQEFNEIRNYIFKLSGIEIRDEKQYLVQQRLEPVVRSFGLNNFTDLIQRMTIDGDMRLRDKVIEAITTNETFFFRDIHPFDTFSNYILPELGERIKKRKSLSSGRKGAKVSIWCAASSTGQEPYSLAMLISEYAETNKYAGIGTNDFSILATDISSEVLAKAISGEYTEMEMGRGLSDYMKKKYFTRKGPNWLVDDTIQSMVDFRRVNLSETFVMLGGFDVIFCRNVLIYFSDDVKKKIIDQFDQMLSDNGFLVLGACESLSMVSNAFENVRHNETIVYKSKKKQPARFTDWQETAP